MMPRVYLILITGAILFASSSCKHKNDSISSLLPDTNHVKTLHDSASHYVYANPKISNDFADQEINVGKDLANYKLVIRGILDKGNVYWITGNYPLALDTYNEALRLSDTLNDQRLIARCFGNIANVHVDMKQYKKAVEFAIRAEDIDAALQDKVHLILDYTNIGEDYEHYKNDSAMFYEELAKTVITNSENKDHLGRVYLNIGNIFALQKNIPLSRDYLNLCLPLLTKEKDYHSLSQAYMGIANGLIQQKKNDSSLIFAKQALNNARQGKYPLGILNADTMIYYLFKHRSNTNSVDSSLSYLESAKAERDSLYSIDNVVTLESMTTKEEQRELREAELKKQQQEEFEENVQYVVIAAIIPLFFLAVLAISRYKIKPLLVESMGLVGLLSFFELITMLIHHFLSPFTHDKPIYMLPILTVIAFLLLPFHHKMQNWMKKLLIPNNPKVNAHL